MVKESPPPDPRPGPGALSWQQRVGELRHDLRNPLSEILGFAEILLDEARERKLSDLANGLETIRIVAYQILADVNHALNPDTLRLMPAKLLQLKESTERLAERILTTAQELSVRCAQAGESALRDDLLLVCTSATRLHEIAPARLGALSGFGTFDDPQTSGDADNPFDEPRSEFRPFEGETATGAILIVDDQETNRALLARRLGKRGYALTLAASGGDAIELLRTQQFDLILLDILMPGIDGVEVLRQVKGNPEWAHIPVLMLSALDELDAVAHCIQLGAADFLPKPFPAAILHARVHACLVSKRMSDQLRKYTTWLFGKALFSHALAGPASLVMSRQERTILFADIRGFTRWSEQHGPEETVAMLNAYFEAGERVWAVSPVIKTEYTGDEIMGVLPTAADAVRVARALREVLGRVLAQHELGVGIGLHTGPVIEGVMGGADVKSYRFVGDTVNTGRRICSEAGPGQVLLSETTFAQAATLLVAAPPFDVFMKGKTEPSKVRLLIEVCAADPASASSGPFGAKDTRPAPPCSAVPS